MDADLKKILKAVSLELRHTLEGTYDERGDFHPGDLGTPAECAGRVARPTSQAAERIAPLAGRG